MNSPTRYLWHKDRTKYFDKHPFSLEKIRIISLDNVPKKIETIST